MSDLEMIEKMLPKAERKDLAKIGYTHDAFTKSGERNHQETFIPLTHYFKVLDALKIAENSIRGLEIILKEKLPIEDYSNGNYAVIYADRVRESRKQKPFSP